MITQSPRRLAVVALCASLVALAGAYYFQYVEELQPCPLCLYQRWPYYVAIVFSGLAALPHSQVHWPIYLIALCGVAFTIGGGIAGYHAGVELGWFEGLAACQGGGGSGAASVEELMAEIMNTEPVSCSDVPWSLFGISIAGYNVLYSAGLAALCFTAVVADVRRRAAHE